MEGKEIIVTEKGMEFLKQIEDTLYKAFGSKAKDTCDTLMSIIAPLPEYMDLECRKCIKLKEEAGNEKVVKKIVE